MKNKAFIGAIAASLVPGQATMAQNKAVKATADRPNIIFILADDLGYGDLSCYGSKTIKTPNIDKLAATGTRFNQSYAGSGISSPSRCALMTGKNTGNSRIRDNMCTAGGMTGLKITPEGDTTIVRRTSLQPQDTTIATVLHAAGYKTCLVNKWHLDGYDPKSSPIYRGFDEFHGWLISTVESNSPYYYPYNRFDNDKLIHIKANEHDKHIKHNTDISTDDAINFIKRNKKNPFFLYLAFDAPHEPYIIDNTTWYDDESWSMNDKRYASLVTHMDAAIGRLLTYLEKNNLRENTLVIFASDNGAAVQAPLKLFNCNAGFRGRKAQLYEGGIRVPFIVNQSPVRQCGQVHFRFADVKESYLGRVGRRRRPHVSGIIGQGRIRFMADGRNDRYAGMVNGLDHSRAVEAPQVFHGAAAAADDEDVQVPAPAHLADGLGDGRIDAVALDGDGMQDDFGIRIALAGNLIDVVEHGAGLRCRP